MSKLLYQGHGSFRLTANNGAVVYIDPFVEAGCDLPADIILVSHQHEDHNQVGLLTPKPDCLTITNVEALQGGKHNSFEHKGIQVEAVDACNANHPANECVGFILTIDGFKLYFACDTSTTEQMSTFAARHLDYAFLCGDGYYNMSLAEAAAAAELIGARHNVPVHLNPGKLFDREMAEQFAAPNKLILEAGAEIELE